MCPAQEYIKDMENAVIEHGWEGNWDLSDYDSNSNKVGSHENDEGNIFIESQGFCAMAGIGNLLNYPQKALYSVKEFLDTPHGVFLFHPPYSKYHLELGEVSSYLPGYKENGGIYCHNKSNSRLHEKTFR